jgi:hypothetical protein
MDKREKRPSLFSLPNPAKLRRPRQVSIMTSFPCVFSKIDTDSKPWKLQKLQHGSGRGAHPADHAALQNL